MDSDKTAGNRDVVTARRSVVKFRSKWKRALQSAGAKQLTFGDVTDLRTVFALPDDHPSLKKFERAIASLRSRVERVLGADEKLRARDMWVPTFVRGCHRVRVVESEPVQQQKSSLQQARAFARKCGVMEIRKDREYAIRRYANTPELLIETTEGGEEGWTAAPFTEWAVVGYSVLDTTHRNRLRKRKWKGRPSAQSQNEAWAERRQMNLICQSGQASLYGGPPFSPEVPTEKKSCSPERV